MTIPVHIEGHLVSLAQLPDATCRQTLVTILQIVELHVDGIFATGTIDTLPIGTALGIEFQVLHQVEG